MGHGSTLKEPDQASLLLPTYSCAAEDQRQKREMCCCFWKL